MRTCIRIFALVLVCSLAVGCYHRENPAAITEWNRGPVEEQPSGTAMWCAFLRALATAESREEIRGRDSLAEIFLSDNLKKILKDPALRKWAMKNQASGMYAYLIARTFFFDHIVEQALRENIPQIVILGTGYDSRPYRFKNLIQNTRFFELDTHPTLQHKKELLQQANIPIPKNVIFVPINFVKDTFEDVFSKGGYNKNQKTLFILEGVVYYIGPKAVDDTLRFIKSNSPAGSTVCFDYTSSHHGIEGAQLDNLKELGDLMKANFPDEPSSQWTIEEWEMKSFLSNRGYQIIDHLRAKRDDIQRKYFKFSDGSSVGCVPAVFGLVHAAVAPSMN
jgi:methyltransferase (TIGR00027 family)